jgi:hypothetical protein
VTLTTGDRENPWGGGRVISQDFVSRYNLLSDR